MLIMAKLDVESDSCYFPTNIPLIKKTNSVSLIAFGQFQHRTKVTIPLLYNIFGEIIYLTSFQNKTQSDLILEMLFNTQDKDHFT